MFVQIGNITNIFGAPVRGAQANPVVAVILGGVTVAVSVALVPLVLALTGALLALASVLLGAAALVGATGLAIGVPYAARQFRIGAEANREAVYGHALMMGAAYERQRMAGAQRQELPAAPLYVASEQGIAIEAQPVGRR